MILQNLSQPIRFQLIHLIEHSEQITAHHTCSPHPRRWTSNQIRFVIQHASSYRVFVKLDCDAYLSSFYLFTLQIPSLPSYTPSLFTACWNDALSSLLELKGEESKKEAEYKTQSLQYNTRDTPSSKGNVLWSLPQKSLPVMSTARQSGVEEQTHYPKESKRDVPPPVRNKHPQPLTLLQSNTGNPPIRKDAKDGAASTQKLISFAQPVQPSPAKQHSRSETAPKSSSRKARYSSLLRVENLFDPSSDKAENADDPFFP